MKRNIALMAVLALLVVGGVAVATVVAYMAADPGGTYTSCTIVARTSEDAIGWQVPADVLAAHPALAEALSTPNPGRATLIPLESCNERDALVNDLDSRGATRLANSDVTTFVLERDGTVFLVELGVDVA